MSNKINIAPLYEVCSEIIDCVNKTAPVVNEVTPYKMIRTTNVKRGRINVNDVRYVTEEVFNKWTRRAKPKYGDIILTREAPLGEVGLIRSDDNIFLGQRLIQYRANEEFLDQKFLYYAFQDSFMQGQIRSYGSGSTVEHLRIRDCETIKVKYPNLSTQRKIAYVLSAYDDLIENNNQRIQLLEEMAEEIYKEWFVRMRFPGHEKTKFFDDEGKEVPHGTKGALPGGWEKMPIKSLVDIISGFAFKSELFVERGEYKLVTIKNVQNGFFVPKTTDQIDELPGKLKREIFIGDKDILMSLTGNIGRICLAYGENYLLNQRVAKLKPKQEQYCEFSYLHFRSELMRKTLENYANGAAQQNLSPVELGELCFAIPDEGLLLKFSKIVAPMLNEIVTLNKKNKLLQETRDLLLPRLISGKLSVDHIKLEEELEKAHS